MLLLLLLMFLGRGSGLFLPESRGQATNPRTTTNYVLWKNLSNGKGEEMGKAVEVLLCFFPSL